MDWKLAISRNREALREIVAGLFLLARMRVGGGLGALPRATLAAVMLGLRPAEAAVRRLIVILAAMAGQASAAPRALDAAQRARLESLPALPPQSRSRAFRLFDPLKGFDPESIWDAQPAYESWFGDDAMSANSSAAPDDAAVDAAAIGQRLNALMRALDDLPRQARRLVRWQVKRDALLKAGLTTRLSPMRPGLPPGWRQRRLHAVDPVLRESHGLAHDLMNAPDSG